MGQRIRLALFGLVLLLPASALAQRTTGFIAGTVRDEMSGALPGVTVAVSGPNIVGSQTTVTNQSGFYRLSNLPPGDYQLSFALAGFKTLLREGVRASVGGTAEENAVLVVSPLAEEIEVRAHGAVVDTSSNQVGTNYERSWIENAPLARYSFLDIAASAPGSLSGGDTSLLLVYGSSRDENSFLLDGGSITDHVEGLGYVRPNIDAIEEVQVLSLGAPAEYGGASGAIYNVVTRQGTNEFHGDANVFIQAAGLTGNNTGGYPPLADGSFVDSCPSDPTRHCPFERETYKELTLQLGGPVVKDRLWFFASYQRRLERLSDAGTEPPAHLDHAIKHHAYLFKLNYQLSARHKLQATFHLDDERWPTVFPANWAPTTAAVFEKTTPTPGLSYTGTLSDKSVVELRYSGFFSNRTEGPLDPDQPRDLPAIYNFDTGYHSGGLGRWHEAYWGVSTLDAKLSHFSDDFLGGSHEFRFGVQYQDSPNGVDATADSYINVYNSGEGYGFGTLTSSASGATRGIGAFVDDTFRVNDRLSLNLGLRFDHEKAFSAEHDQVDQEGRPTGVRIPQQDLFTWTTLSPRLGFNWKLTPDGKTVLRGHWGRYHRGTFVYDWVGANVVPYTNYYGVLIPGTLELTDVIFIEHTGEGRLAIDPQYVAPRSDQFVVSLERELAPNLGLQATYVYKRGRRYPRFRDVGGIYREVVYVDDQGADATGRPITVYQLQNNLSDISPYLANGSELDQDVHAASLVLLKRLSRNWFLNGSLTWQRAVGRGSLSGDSTLLQSSLAGIGLNPNDFVNTGGRLGADVPLQVKVQCLYSFPRGFSASLNFGHHAGGHLVRHVRVAEITNLPRTTVLGEERGRLGRLPAITQLDLRVQKDFNIGKRLRLGLFADVLNLLNDDAYQGTLNDIGTSPQYHQPGEFFWPRRVMLGAKLRF